jgi:hypothetical protein
MGHNIATVKNVGRTLEVFHCGAASPVAADGAIDNVAVTGATINRMVAGTEGDQLNSGKLILSYMTTLTAAKTLSFAIAYQESADGSSWDTAVALQTATVAATGAVTASLGTVEYNVNLHDKKQYIRFNYTPDLSHSGTDTATTSLVFVAGGGPIPQ